MAENKEEIEVVVLKYGNEMKRFKSSYFSYVGDLIEALENYLWEDLGW